MHVSKKSPQSLKCFGTAWVIGWAVAVFLPSALIALSQIHNDLSELLPTTWRIADEVGAFVKISIGLVFLALCWSFSKIGLSGTARNLTAYSAAGILAIVTPLLFMPESYSRGYGVGLTGVRLDPHVLVCYLAGAIAAGTALFFSFNRCQTQTSRNGTAA